MVGGRGGGVGLGVGRRGGVSKGNRCSVVYKIRKYSIGNHI